MAATRSPKVAVVGAGIVGLAAADALCQAGAEVRLFEKAMPGQAESVGLTRIFRHAHGDAALVRLAMRAGDGWRAWERRYGRCLLGTDGLVVTGDLLAPQWERAMCDAGAPCRALDAAAFRELLPIGDPPPSVMLFDPAAGAIRARRTIDLLRRDLAGRLVGAEVRELAVTGTGASVRTVGETWACDEVLVTAGVDTPGLAARVGVQVPANFIRHSRFTFAPRTPRTGRVPACWIDESGAYGAGLTSYALPVGATDRYAVGVSQGDEGYPAEIDAEVVSRRTLVAARRYLPAALPGLDTEPVGEVRCMYNEIGFPRGDGFAAVRQGHVTVFYGNNLFKFAPLLGELLCQAVLQGEVPAELLPRG